MTKAEFIEAIQKNGEYPTKQEAEKAVNIFLKTLGNALENKEKVPFVGFGTFSTVEVKEKSGKVPGTDRKYVKPAHTAVKFKPGKALKDAVNQ
jgi:DNA-binding protein HU-beta